MTIEELLAQVPEELRPVAAKYGPALLKMTADELWAWVEMLIAGDTMRAYRAVCQKHDNTALLAAADGILMEWEDANAENASRIELQKSAITGVLAAALKVAGVALGVPFF